jgi:hypothetical protein
MFPVPITGDLCAPEQKDASDNTRHERTLGLIVGDSEMWVIAEKNYERLAWRGLRTMCTHCLDMVPLPPSSTGCTTP